MAKGTTPTLRCNEQIRISPIRLIGAGNEQVGIVETYEALRTAREQGLDLVEVAPNERPPVCRIMDYGKFKYHQKKHHKKRHEQQLKEVRLRPKTDKHDRMIKLNRALQFLAEGDKVQFTIQFRGRERAHREIAVAILQQLLAELGERAKTERPPSMDGRNLIMIVAPTSKAAAKPDRLPKGPHPPRAAGEPPAGVKPSPPAGAASRAAQPTSAAAGSVEPTPPDSHGQDRASAVNVPSERGAGR